MMQSITSSDLNSGVHINRGIPTGITPPLSSPVNRDSSRRRSNATGGRRLWVPARPRRRGNAMTGVDAAARGQAFCYCAPRGDVLIVSQRGDVVYLTYLRDKSNKLRPCRVSVRAANPLRLLLGKVTKEMCQEIKEIIASSQKNTAFNLPTREDNDLHHVGGDGGGGGSREEGEEGGGGGEERRGELFERDKRGGFIGKESFPTQALAILSDTLWVSSYHVAKLPSGLKKMYATVAHMLEAVKCKLPKLILYLTEKKDPHQPASITQTITTPRTQPKEEDQALCKCMIMCNDPLPDFSVRWSDGTKLRYCLSNGQLRITNNQGNTANHYNWAGVACTDADWTTSAPESIRQYLLLAQSAMRRCIAEDITRHQELESRGDASCEMEYPIIVVDAVDNT